MEEHGGLKTITREDKIDGGLVDKEQATEMESDRKADVRVTECKMEG